jgi:hypothetical protein
VRCLGIAVVRTTVFRRSFRSRRERFTERELRLSGSFRNCSAESAHLLQRRHSDIGCCDHAYTMAFDGPKKTRSRLTDENWLLHSNQHSRQSLVLLCGVLLAKQARFTGSPIGNSCLVALLAGCPIAAGKRNSCCGDLTTDGGTISNATVNCGCVWK